MKTAKVGRHTIKYYDGDVTEMPVTRFNTFQRFLLIDAGIGGTVEDADKHVSRIQVYLQKKEYDKALVEAQNFRQNIRFVIEGISPKDLAFCALIHSVDGELHTDLSDEGNTELSKRLQKAISRSWFDGVIEGIKKKVGMT